MAIAVKRETAPPLLVAYVMSSGIFLKTSSLRILLPNDMVLSNV